MEWTDAEVEILKAGWADGVSASYIALGLRGRSKNSVIGKAHRIGLPRRAPTVARKARKRLRRDKVSHEERQILNGIKRSTERKVTDMDIPSAPPPESTEIEIPVSQRCTFFELTDDTCKYPIGEVGREDFFFCGAMTVGGLPYCKAHCMVAYRPIKR